MSFLDLFRKPAARKVADAPRPSLSKEQHGAIAAAVLMQFGQNMVSELAHTLNNEQDIWWFLAEQYDQCMDSNENAQDIIRGSSLNMHTIEYEGRRSENSYVGKPNPGVGVLSDARLAIATQYNKQLAEMMVAQIFVSFTEQNMTALNAIRIKYAEHFQKNCIRDGAPRNAGRWQDVIDDIRSR